MKYQCQISGPLKRSCHTDHVGKIWLQYHIHFKHMIRFPLNIYDRCGMMAHGLVQCGFAYVLIVETSYSRFYFDWKLVNIQGQCLIMVLRVRTFNKNHMSNMNAIISIFQTICPYQKYRKSYLGLGQMSSPHPGTVAKALSQRSNMPNMNTFSSGDILMSHAFAYKRRRGWGKIISTYGC